MRILWLSFLLLILAQLAHPQQDPTTLIFYYEHEDEQAEDYIQVEVLVEAEGTSLTSTINSATATAAEIKTIAMDYCRGNKGKGDCKEAAEVTNVLLRSPTSRSSPSTRKYAGKTPSKVPTPNPGFIVSH